MKLSELHSLLQDSILTSEPLIHPYLESPPKGSIADRVSIYADGFYARLEEALNSDYSSLAVVLGEEKFSKMSRRYTQEYPSYNYSLNHFGKNLKQFLTEFLPYKKEPYLAEIAAFEWAEYQALISFDATLLYPVDLQSLPVNQWPEMKIQLHPSCTLLSLNWNSLAQIQAVRKNKSVPTPKKLQSSQCVLIWRRELDVLYRVLKGPEQEMIKAIFNKATFMEICEILSRHMLEDQVATYVVKELHAWIQEGCFIK